MAGKMTFGILFVLIFVVNTRAAVKDYCIIDLSGGASAASYPVAYMDSIPAGGWSDEYKTAKLVLRYIAPGSFNMGGTRPVRFTRAYYIGVFEVTQKQYELVTGKNPSGKNGSTKFIGDTHPVESVSYKTIRGTTQGATWPWTADVDPDTFLGRLRARTGLDGFDLPTDAQWEYACRAGTATVYSYGDSVNGDYMWYNKNSESVHHPVGTRLPNPWGLYDMHGNVWEWCLDWYQSDLGTAAVNDPVGPFSGSGRVHRGGTWYSDAMYAKSSWRGGLNVDDSGIDYNDGFRIVCNVDEPLRALIAVTNGVPYLNWTPNLNTNETLRIYRVLGKRELTNETWSVAKEGDHFFKVKSSMPNGFDVSDQPGPIVDHLLCHLSFDDQGNGGLNVLKVEGGEDAVVRTTKANVVSGLGEVTVVTNPEILDGLEDGDGAVCIPRGTHLALPIPMALKDRPGHPYTIKMTFNYRWDFPSVSASNPRWNALLNMPDSNDTDALVYLDASGPDRIQMKLEDKRSGKGINGEVGFKRGRWETLVIQFGETYTRAYLNGTQVFGAAVKLADSYADCYDAGDYFVIAGDDDGDDNACYWADVKVYDGIVDP